MIGEAPSHNWDLPDVELPEDDGTYHDFTPEQWVRWFRTQSTFVQIRVAAQVLELQHEANRHFNQDTEGRLGRANDTVESLRDHLRGIKDGCRSILEDVRKVKSAKRRSAMLAERLTAIGVSIKESGL